MKEYGIYCLSKAGLHHLTLLLAKEFAPDVRVNAIAPGAIIWPEDENNLTEEQKNKIIARTALKRPGHPDNIAKAVKFLLADAPYITGDVIHVDGGRRLFSY
jgi:pteridine reductase